MSKSCALQAKAVIAVQSFGKRNLNSKFLLGYLCSQAHNLNGCDVMRYYLTRKGGATKRGNHLTKS